MTVLTRYGLTRLVEECVRRSGLAQVVADEAQLDEVRSALTHAIGVVTHDLSHGDRYADEVVSPEMDFQHKAILDARQQCALLRRHLPNLSGHNPGFENLRVPEDAYGHFAIPRWRPVASTYHEAVLIVLEALKEERGEFLNFCGDKLACDTHLDEHSCKAKLVDIASEQRADILIVPGQIGLRHIGKSGRRSRFEFNGNGEFGLGIFEVGSILLSHPEYLAADVAEGDFWISCVGDMYSDSGAGGFSSVPAFVRIAGKLGIVRCPNNMSLGHMGAATGFVPTGVADGVP